MNKYVIGVDIGGTTIKFGLFLDNGDLIEKFAIPTDTSNDGEKLLPDTANAIINKLTERGIAKDDVLGVGLGIPGPVNEDGIVLFGANIGWENPVPVKAILTDLLDMKVNVTNDANIAALGEIWLGAAKGTKSAVMYTLGTGVGGGIVIDGKVINGAHGAGGEIGHLTAIPIDGPQCGCGKRGCLETVASATGIVRVAKEALELTEFNSTLHEVENLEAKDIFDAARTGDVLAKELVDQVGFYLGLSAANLAVSVDPEKIIFGGGVAYAGEILIDAITRYYKKYALKSIRDIPIILATLGNDAGIIGGAFLAKE